MLYRWRWGACDCTRLCTFWHRVYTHHPLGTLRRTWDISIHDPAMEVALQRPSVSRFLRDDNGCKFLLPASAFCRSPGTLCVSDSRSTGHRSHRVALVPGVGHSLRKHWFCIADSGLRSGLSCRHTHKCADTVCKRQTDCSDRWSDPAKTRH